MREARAEGTTRNTLTNAEVNKEAASVAEQSAHDAPEKALSKKGRAGKKGV